MVLGGDLPITYETSSAMFTSFFIGFTGYASFSLCTGICVIFVDPALGICWKEYRKSETSPSVEVEQLSEDHIIMSQRAATIWASNEESDETKIGSWRTEGNDRRSVQVHIGSQS